jgi:hypothetical protein
MKLDWIALAATDRDGDTNTSTQGDQQHGFLEDSDSDTNEELSSNERLELELKSYRLAKCEPMTVNPLDYWRKNAGQFPHLAKQAEKLLSIPATSVPCERLFSAAGILVSKRRAALRPDHIQQMLCLQSWIDQDQDSRLRI